MASDELPTLLAAAPRRFRSALMASRAGRAADADDIRLLELTARLEAEARRPCQPPHVVPCLVLAREAALLGGELAETGARRLRTIAQAECYLARWRGWLAARERLLASAAQASPMAPTLAADDDDPGLLRPAYLRYDARKYDFRGLVSRIFAAHLGSEAEQRERGGDALAMLHATPTGRSEAGYLSAVAGWREAGMPYSRELDEATRLGCGTFHRVFKESGALRDEFLRLYRSFVAEVVSPLLGSPRLVYQSQPVFRVFLPHHLAVGPRHTDEAYHAQPNELNFWVPLTDCYNSNSLLVESRPAAADFEPATGGVGSAYRFRGNQCEHYTELNVSGATRVSFDFRVIREQELDAHPVPGADDGEGSPDGDEGEARIERGQAAYFRVGRYYSRLDPGGGCS